MTKNKAIVLIHKDKFEYYDEAQSKIFQFIFQPNLIQDLEIIDIDQVKNQIKTFVQTNKLTPAQILFIISDFIIFEKVIPAASSINKQMEIEKYLETIPFEHVSYKIINRQKDYIVMAINKELFTSLQDSFSPLGFSVL